MSKADKLNGRTASPFKAAIQKLDPRPLVNKGLALLKEKKWSLPKPVKIITSDTYKAGKAVVVDSYEGGKYAGKRLFDKGLGIADNGSRKILDFAADGGKVITDSIRNIVNGGIKTVYVAGGITLAVFTGSVIKDTASPRPDGKMTFPVLVENGWRSITQTWDLLKNGPSEPEPQTVAPGKPVNNNKVNATGAIQTPVKNTGERELPLPSPILQHPNLNQPFNNRSSENLPEDIQEMLEKINGENWLFDPR